MENYLAYAGVLVLLLIAIAMSLRNGMKPLQSREGEADARTSARNVKKQFGGRTKTTTYRPDSVTKS